jgi:hypothetical protein
MPRTCRGRRRGATPKRELERICTSRRRSAQRRPSAALSHRHAALGEGAARNAAHPAERAPGDVSLEPPEQPHRLVPAPVAAEERRERQRRDEVRRVERQRTAQHLDRVRALRASERAPSARERARRLRAPPDLGALRAR